MAIPIGERAYFVDKETGVNYITFLCAGGGLAVCPRYNADGTLYVTEVKG